MLKKYGAILALALLSGNVMASTIDTTTSYVTSIVPFSDSNTATYGQTFTVGSDNVLESFSFYLDHASNTVDFRAYVYQWDGGKASGTALYTSDLLHFSSTANTEFALDTQSLALTSGNQYVAFLSTSGIAGGEDGSAQMRLAGNVYDGGEFVYFNNGDDLAALTQQTWDHLGGLGDAWFKASFSRSPTTNPVPEAETYAMLLAGLGLIGVVARRRKQALA